MTNKEKYLKEEIDVHNMACEMIKFFENETNARNIFIDDIETFFRRSVKHTLTDDERVILRNMAKPAQKFMLYRNTSGGLLLRDKDKVIHYEFFVYDKLFQFIKERRRI